MGETDCEQYPLLREEFPAEEHYLGQYHRRGRSMSYRSRTRNHIKGAAAIITRWPDYWSTFLTYWWIGLGMICLTTLIIYNSLFSFTTFSSAKSMPTNLKISTTPYTVHNEPFVNHVYMHIIVNKSTSVDLNSYIPLIEAIAKNYTLFCYHLIIIENDTLNRKDKFKAEENNENALNILFNDEDIFNEKQTKTKLNNILIEHISLTKFMDDSPAKKYWWSLSKPLIEFLIRVSSIWEKGGIAINPLILKTPWSLIYKEKMKNVLEEFKSKETKDYIYNKVKPQKYAHIEKKNHRRVNNIRDIINNLENENNLNINSDDVLIEAENKNRIYFSAGSRKLLFSADANIKNTYFPKIYNTSTTLDSNMINSDMDAVNYKDEIKTIMNKNISSSLSLLPSFLDFLFHRYPENSNTQTFLPRNKKRPKKLDLSETEHETTTKLEFSDKIISKPVSKPSPIHKAKAINPITVPIEYLYQETEKPLIVEISKTNSNDYKDFNRMVIDTKGNIIATNTSCHAFLGTIFNNAVHQEQNDKVTDFIISQLSIFCKGAATCNGIDLILL